MNIIFGLLITAGITFSICHAKEAHKVHCSEDLMRVEIVLPTNQVQVIPQIYLEKMKGYPNPNCQPIVTDRLAEFRLSLIDVYECGVTRVVNRLTGKTVYYHKIILETDNNKEIVSVKCITTINPISSNATKYIHHGIAKRDVLPIGFEEPIELDYRSEISKSAPDPILSVAVRQGNEIVTGELNVSPGTPLAMEIYLDKISAPVYGLGVTYMQVTDTKSQEETIIFNGCSIDPYLFDNFNTIDGDFLTAKFRAFKFPESTYVQFRGTVNVCLDKCRGVQCSNGQIGYGRKRRAIDDGVMDPNRVYEISMATFIKVNYENGADQNEISELEQKLKQLKISNQKLGRNSRAHGGSSIFESVQDYRTDKSDAVVEETTFVAASVSNNTSTTKQQLATILPLILLLLILL